MSATKLLAVIGSKKSGKTTTIECVISGLTKKKIRVGSVKHIHDPDFTIDTKGRDTWRHAQAGARIVTGVSGNEIAVIVKDGSQETLNSVLDFMTRTGLDLIVVEGLHSSIGQRQDVFKIVTAHDAEDLRRRLRDTVPPVIAASGVVAEKISALGGIFVPIINSRTECSKLVDRIEEEVIRKL